MFQITFGDYAPRQTGRQMDRQTDGETADVQKEKFLRIC